MVRTIIEAFPKEKKQPGYDSTPLDNDGKLQPNRILNIAECFTDTIQGENLSGFPATFLRLQYCTLNCNWCDTAEVWRKGNPYSVDELVSLFEKEGVIDNLKKGQHLVLTGGSPLKQQDSLYQLINQIGVKYNFKPYIEIENECVLMPNTALIKIIDCWNNSPKLSNSGMRETVRYKPEVIKVLANLKNSYFKFVVSGESDWNEIDNFFLSPGLIKKEQIVLMPEGQTREQLQAHYDSVIDLAVKYNVRMTDRTHISIWDKKTGV